MIKAEYEKDLSKYIFSIQERMKGIAKMVEPPRIKDATRKKFMKRKILEGELNFRRSVDPVVYAGTEDNFLGNTSRGRRRPTPKDQRQRQRPVVNLSEKRQSDAPSPSERYQ